MRTHYIVTRLAGEEDARAKVTAKRPVRSDLCAWVHPEHDELGLISVVGLAAGDHDDWESFADIAEAYLRADLARLGDGEHLDPEAGPRDLWPEHEPWRGEITEAYRVAADAMQQAAFDAWVEGEAGR